MYKIFHENKTLVFPKIEGNSLKFDATLKESDRYESDILCDFLQEWLYDSDQTDTFVHEVGENAVSEALKQTFRMAPAAGGVVVVNGKIVTITRNSIPDLPKGHIERGEHPEQAALREVEEETGIGKLRIVKEWRLKRTYWYLMECVEDIQTKPQTEEGISEVKLVGNEEIDAFLKNTFRSISEILGGDMRQVVAK